jgi:hypothetical protein
MAVFFNFICNIIFKGFQAYKGHISIPRIRHDFPPLSSSNLSLTYHQDLPALL